LSRPPKSSGAPPRFKVHTWSKGELREASRDAALLFYIFITFNSFNTEISFIIVASLGFYMVALSPRRNNSRTVVCTSFIVSSFHLAIWASWYVTSSINCLLGILIPISCHRWARMSSTLGSWAPVAPFCQENSWEMPIRVLPHSDRWANQAMPRFLSYAGWTWPRWKPVWTV
jgi:hypothetical protein